MVCTIWKAVCFVLFCQYNLELALHVQGENKLQYNFFLDKPLRQTVLLHIYCSYQIAFADHQKHMAKLEGISEKCTGLKNYDWYDNLKGETFN